MVYFISLFNVHFSHRQKYQISYHAFDYDKASKCENAIKCLNHYFSFFIRS